MSEWFCESKNVVLKVAACAVAGVVRVGVGSVFTLMMSTFFSCVVILVEDIVL